MTPAHTKYGSQGSGCNGCNGGITEEEEGTPVEAVALVPFFFRHTQGEKTIRDRVGPLKTTLLTLLTLLSLHTQLQSKRAKRPSLTIRIIGFISFTAKKVELRYR